MHHVILDGYNLFHRARGGFQKGEWPIVFNFFRGLRPLVEQLKPDALYLVLEGEPKRNKELLSSYKANRASAPADFERQCSTILDVMRSMPIITLRHLGYEADDVIANITHRLRSSGGVTIVSSDSDFTQLVDDGVRVWNWRTKEFVVKPDYDYVTWKALRGDPTDNIPRVPGVTEETAMMMAKDANLLTTFVSPRETLDAYMRNRELVGLAAFTAAEWAEVEIVEGCSDWPKVHAAFESFAFRSMLKETTWAKYVATLSCLADPLQLHS